MSAGGGGSSSSRRRRSPGSSTGRDGRKRRARSAKAYLEIVEPPVSRQFAAGSKLQARTASVYSVCEPSREQLRKSNYDRRHRQLTSQGYLTPCHKPYESIGGEPILDEEQLVRLTLGQSKADQAQMRGDVMTDDAYRGVFSLKNLIGGSSRAAAVDKARTEGKPPRKEKRPPGWGKYDPNQLKAGLHNGRRSVLSVQLGRGWFGIMEEETQQKLDRQRRLAEAELEKMVDPNESNDSFTEQLDYNIESVFHKCMSRNAAGRIANAGNNAVRRATTFSAKVIRRHSPPRESDVTSELSGEKKQRASSTAISRAETASVTLDAFSDDQLISDDDSSDQGQHSSDQQISDHFEVTSNSNRNVYKQSATSAGNYTTNLDELGPEKAQLVRTTKSALAYRPFTPKFNLNQNFKRVEQDPSTVEKRDELLYNQLCVLLWLLNSLTVDPPFVYSELSTCFSRVNPGGEKIHRGKIQREKLAEKEWEATILSKPAVKPKKNNNLSVPQTGRTRLSSVRRYSQSSVMSNSSVVSFAEPLPTRTKPSKLPGLAERSILLEADESVSRPSSGASRVPGKPPAGFRSRSDSRVNSVSTHVSHPSSKRGSIAEKESSSSERALTVTSEEEKEHSSDLGNNASSSRASSARSEKAKIRESDSKSLSGESEVASKSVPEIQVVPAKKRWEFKPYTLTDEDFANLAEKKSKVPTEMKDEFQQTVLEAGLSLSDIMAQHERIRKDVSIAKFHTLSQVLSDNKEFHRGMDSIHQVTEEFRMKDSQRKAQYTQWYISLIETLPVDFTENPKNKLLLNRIMEYGRLGKIQSKRLTPNALKGILNPLRDWELCHPNVRAAIDFVKDHISGMSQTEFLDWFALKSPSFAALEAASVSRNKST